ncbi:unnamed protein product, partial [Iphiclides podalirius]
MLIDIITRRDVWMMDDSSEAQMETDVSSTTVDVPEMQEITGSSGNVEMVILVEKVQEENTLPNEQEQLNEDKVVSDISIQSVQGSEDSSQNEKLLLQPQDGNLLTTIDGAEILLENQDITQRECLNKSPKQSEQLPLALSDIPPKAALSPVQVQPVQEIPDSSSKDTNMLKNKDMEFSEKANQLEKNADDHQYATKDSSIQMEQCDPTPIELKEPISDVPTGDKKEDSSKSVLSKVPKPETESLMSDEDIEEIKHKDCHNESTTSTPKKKKMLEEPASEKTNKLRSDPYCWRCHWAVEQVPNEKMHHPMLCTVCPRSFHFKCLSGTERNKITTDKNWVCPECLSVLHAESSETRSPAMKKISLGVLCELLKHALERMMDLNGVEPFMHPVDRTAFPDYDRYVVHPMDLTLMKNNIDEGLYGSTEAFIADAQWILHNSIIFNTLQSKLTGGARALVRSCRTEMGEIEACPECYAAAHARRPTWFTDVCSTPHVLLWAKLKGFPHWPAKAMSVNSSGLVDVRFFGAHDRAWVPAKDCYLYSEKDPNNFRTKRQDILDSMQEAEQHIRNISRKYGKFVYPPFKTQFDPAKLSEQIKMMIPSFEGEVRSMVKEKPGGTPQSASKDKSRSNSKSSKSSVNDGDMSEGEDLHVTPTRKMADGAEIAKEEDDYSINDKNKSIEVDVTVQKSETSRKRRRSDLEEAVITIMDNTGTMIKYCDDHKRRRTDDVNGEVAQSEEEPKEKSTSSVDKPMEQGEKVKDEPVSDKNKGGEPSTSSTDIEKSMESVPVKSASKVKPLSKTSTPKDKETAKDKNTEGFSTPKQRPARTDKLTPIEKEDKPRSQRRRNSKHKCASSNGERTDRNPDKKVEKSADSTSGGREKRDNSTKQIKEADTDKSAAKRSVSTVKSSTDSPTSSKERKQIDDDTVLADLARETKASIISNSAAGLPTISSVRSLSVAPSGTNTTAAAKTVEVTIEMPSESSVFTPTSTENVRNMREAVDKLQRLRSEGDPPPVGRVGVRAFARMTSPDRGQKEKEREREKEPVEIKSEPLELDDAERQTEKLDLMNAFKLRPVIQTATNNLREVRINKVVVAPLSGRKSAPKPPEMRVRAKKTFPQPKKPDEGRSELNGKNSMVYIPIQPPMTQAPVRGVRPPSLNGPANVTAPRMPAPTVMTPASGINTLTSPMLGNSVPSSISSAGSANTVTSNALSTVPSAGQMPNLGQIPTVGQVATNVHTVPLITSVNGQWTFSLQPVMSVGGVDDTPTPIVNGIAERGNAGPIMSLPTQLAHLSALTSPAMPNASASASATSSTALMPVSSANPMQGNRNDTPADLPRLQQRPPLLNPFDASTPMGCVPPPSTAGPLTAKLNQNAVKLTDFFRTLLEDSLEKIDEPASQLTAMKLQLEQTRWRHQQEIDEIKHNHELVLAEMRASFEKEKFRAVNDVRRASQIELESAVKLAKSKQWCANCNQEAQFYCCWNTSYCDYPCQRAHWSQHYSVCTQQRSQESNSDGGHDNIIQAPDSLPKTTQAPTLTVGNKLTPLRVFSQDPNNGQKSSIIVSMVEDSSGNQTMKCVGTYKPQVPPQLSSLNINKQMVSTDDNAKKVVTSGGYLIVGGGAAGSANLVTSRRAHTIQYYT